MNLEEFCNPCVVLQSLAFQPNLTTRYFHDVFHLFALQVALQLFGFLLNGTFE
jgi:hypothetical protein